MTAHIGILAVLAARQAQVDAWLAYLEQRRLAWEADAAAREARGRESFDKVLVSMGYKPDATEEELAALGPAPTSSVCLTLAPADDELAEQAAHPPPPGWGTDAERCPKCGAETYGCPGACSVAILCMGEDDCGWSYTELWGPEEF